MSEIQSLSQEMKTDQECSIDDIQRQFEEWRDGFEEKSQTAFDEKTKNNAALEAQKYNQALQSLQQGDPTRCLKILEYKLQLDELMRNHPPQTLNGKLDLPAYRERVNDEINKTQRQIEFLKKSRR